MSRSREEIGRRIMPLVGMSRRGAVRAWMMGRTRELAIRYDEIVDWMTMAGILAEVEVADGQEWFRIWRIEDAHEADTR